MVLGISTQNRDLVAVSDKLVLGSLEGIKLGQGGFHKWRKPRGSSLVSSPNFMQGSSLVGCNNMAV